jgi:hypothetical protein
MTMVDIFARRRNKAIAVILRFKEQECDTFLPERVSDQLRKIILDQINDYHELVCDLVSVYQQGGVVNELYLERLSEIDGRLSEIAGAVNGE